MVMAVAGRILQGSDRTLTRTPILPHRVCADHWGARPATMFTPFSWHARLSAGVVSECARATHSIQSTMKNERHNVLEEHWTRSRGCDGLDTVLRGIAAPGLLRGFGCGGGAHANGGECAGHVDCISSGVEEEQRASQRSSFSGWV